jgi:hypothetical protein
LKTNYPSSISTVSLLTNATLSSSVRRHNIWHG